MGQLQLIQICSIHTKSATRVPHWNLFELVHYIQSVTFMEMIIKGKKGKEVIEV